MVLPALIQAADARGDLYASVNLRIRQLNIACLAADQPAEARRAADEAMRMWNPAAYLSQHYYHLVALASADLYEGDGAAAVARLAAGWRDVERSLFMRVQFIRIEAIHLRGRAALAAARPGADGAALRKRVLADARKLERESMRWANALARLLRAGAAAQEGDGACRRSAPRRGDRRSSRRSTCTSTRRRRAARAEEIRRGRRVDATRSRCAIRHGCAALLVPGVFNLGGALAAAARAARRRRRAARRACKSGRKGFGGRSSTSKPRR